MLNPPPITSLNQLLTDRTAKQLSMERIAATVMAVFESMWSTFISHGGSFDPFMDLYLKRWLHSCVILSSLSLSIVNAEGLSYYIRSQVIS